MTDNQHFLGNDELVKRASKDTPLEVTTSSIFSELNLTSSKEVNKVFDLLLASVIKSTRYDSLKIQTKSTNIFEQLAPNIWMKIAIVGFVSFLVLACATFLTNKNAAILISGKPLLLTALYLLVTVIFLLLFLLSSTIKSFRESNNSQEQLEDDFTELMHGAGKNDLQIIKNVIEEANFRKETLDYVEKKICRSLEAKQDKKTLTQIRIKLLATVLVGAILLIFFLNVLVEIISSGDIRQWLNISAVLSALGVGINLVAQLIAESKLQFALEKLKTCVYILQQAKGEIDNIKASKKSFQAETFKKQQNLFSQLRNIKIDGPEDFAANLDSYLSGEKRIEPNIR